MPDGVPLLFGLVFVIWAAGFVMMSRGDEPYPALVQPGFGYVADEGATIEWSDIRVTVEFGDGRTRPVDATALWGDSAAKERYVTARVAAVAGDEDGIRWLRERIRAAGISADPVALHLELVALTFDVEDLSQGEQRVTDEFVIDLRDVG